MQQADADRAIRACSQLIRKEPNNYLLFMLRGSAYKDKHDFHRALQDLNNAIALNSKDPVNYLGRAFLYWDMGDLERAKSDFRKTLEFDPGNVLSRGALQKLQALPEAAARSAQPPTTTSAPSAWFFLGGVPVNLELKATLYGSTHTSAAALIGISTMKHNAYGQKGDLLNMPCLRFLIIFSC
jgi:tetratricopeptide (TPR) repeat protein